MAHMWCQHYSNMVNHRILNSIVSYCSFLSHWLNHAYVSFTHSEIFSGFVRVNFSSLETLDLLVVVEKRSHPLITFNTFIVFI